MILRDATKYDLPAVSSLWEAMVLEMRPEWTPSRDMWRQMAERFINTGTYHIKVASDNGFLMGFLDWFIWPEPSTCKTHAVAQHFYVKPKYRKKTVGGRLMLQCIEDAKTEGAEMFDLFCFQEGRERWKRRGFQEARIMMRKEVA